MSVPNLLGEEAEVQRAKVAYPRLYRSEPVPAVSSEAVSWLHHPPISPSSPVLSWCPMWPAGSALKFVTFW
jgi:hypothetical protein